MAFTQHESRELSVGEFPSVPRVPPRTSGFRTKWHTLSSSARGLLCFCPADHACKDDWPSDSIVDLNTPARSDVSWQSSRDGTAPLNGMRSRLYQDRTGKVAKHEGRKAVRDKTTTVTTTEHKPSSDAVSSVNAPPIKQRDARRHGLASPLCDHAALLHLNGSRTRGERTGHDVATGDTVEALIDAILQIGDSQGCGSAASLGMPLGIEVGPEEKATTNDGKSKGKKESSAGAWEDTDARRAAWEAMKRRVMHIEEYGALPPEDDDEDDAGDAPDAADAMDHNAERASRECRAWRRRRWAEEAIRGQAREDASRRVVAKKRRRYAGWWIHENKVFARLYARRI